MANSAYWVGDDGNVWGRSANWNGARNLGRAGGISSGNGQAVIHPNGVVTYINRDLFIDNPNPSAPTTAGTGTSAPAGGGGGGGTPPPVFNEAAARNTQLTIDQLPALLEAALGVERQRYQNSMGEFNTQEQGQRQTYDKSTTTNQLNYDENFMDSIRAGVKGLGGLFNILRGTGGAGGDVDDRVRDMVGGITSQDIRTGADTQKENQGQLDTSMSTFLAELGRKRRAADDTLVNNERAVRRDTNTQLQDLYGKMAGYYGEAGRGAEANDWMARAGALTPEIAANSRTQLSNYDTTPVVVQAPQLTAFPEPTQPDVVAPPSDGQVGSGIFTMTDRRRKEQLPVLLPAGA